MFVINKTQETSKTYSRLIGKTLCNIAFISFENPAFIHSFKRDGDNFKYTYIADFEFVDYISAITHTSYAHQSRVVICIDNFPDEVKGLLRMNSDVVGAFKAAFNDLHLDQLAKEA